LGGGRANAWAYGVDNDGDGEPDDANGNGKPDFVVAYSILLQTPDSLDDLANQTERELEKRADKLEVRQGPVSGEAKPGCSDPNSGISRIEDGWLRDPQSTALLRKNFQIDAVVVPDTETGTITTLEVQQERSADRGNKWGAWFRNDMEVFPGPQFQWNGAMHTDGSFFVGSGSNAQGRAVARFQGYLVSGPGSCIYLAGKETSETTANQQFVVGRLVDDVAGGVGVFHYIEGAAGSTVTNIKHHQDKNATSTPPEVALTSNNDSVRSVSSISNIALDPILLFTKDEDKMRGFSDRNQVALTTWGGDMKKEGRLKQDSASRPYIDDFYRADDRYGPNAGYAGKSELQLDFLNVKSGDPITNIPELTQNVAPAGSDPQDLGLDGYWERRAWREGMRIIVGQRLTLGNDPLPVVTDLKRIDKTRLTTRREHESLQRRTLRDNPAAVQTTVIYHSAADNVTGPEDPPYAALLTTVHPGTAETLKRSSSFVTPAAPFGIKTDYNALFGKAFGDGEDEVFTDFLEGRGTNGWQLDIPDNYFSRSPVADALTRLANFSGDPKGAFPAVQDNVVHPYPSLISWGNFSDLNRTLRERKGSFADNSNIHTAAITLGALANNIAMLDGLDYTETSNQQLIVELDRVLQQLDDRVYDLNNYSTTTTVTNKCAYGTTNNEGCDAKQSGVENGEVIFYANEDLDRDGQVDPGEDFDGNNKLFPAVPTMVIYAPQTGTSFTPIARVAPSPEAYIVAIEEQYKKATGADKIVKQRVLDLARTIYQKEQVARDRHFGFQSSFFGFDTLKETLDTTPENSEGVGKYQYLVKHIYNEDLNGDFQLNADPTSGTTGGGAVPGIPTLTRPTGGFKVLEPSSLPDQKLPGEILAGSLLPAENFDGDQTLDITEDFDRNGILDLYLPDTFTEDINGDAKLDTALELGTAKLNEDLNLDGQLTKVNKPIANLTNNADAKRDNFYTEDHNSGNGSPNKGRFNLISEDLNGNGIQDTKLNESTLINPVTGITGWDLNGDGTLADNIEVINEDIDKDKNLFLFRHRGITLNKGVILHLGCDFSKATGNNYFGYGEPKDLQAEARFIRLATSLCSAQPKYPSLYYLFPKYEHDYITSSVDLNGDGVVDAKDNQPFFYLTEDLNQNGRLDPGEDGYDWRKATQANTTRTNKVLDGEPIPYISEEIYSKEGKTIDAYIKAVNTLTYQAVTPEDLTALALKPAAISNWTVPYVDSGNSPPSECRNDATADNPNTNCSRYSLVYYKGSSGTGKYYRVGFKDTAFYDGREMMVTRALNLDVELLSNNASAQKNGTVNGDTWLTGGNDDLNVAKDGGIVYAYREDSLREDAIARPAGGQCKTFADVTGGCAAENALTPSDPALSDDGISPKPVNFIPDPDRRAVGFRLLNGRDFVRDNQGGITEFGLSLISDNAVFVQGDFNCHKAPGDATCAKPIEEFNYTLSDKPTWGVAQFYDSRASINQRDEDFAKPKTDSWRYSEFLVDSFNILSDNFCDGSIEDGLISLAAGDNLQIALQDLKRSSTATIQRVYGCVQTRPVTSYMNQARISSLNSNGITITNKTWLRENPADLNSPIRYSPNSQPMLIGQKEADYNSTYLSVTELLAGLGPGKDIHLTLASPQRVNAVMVAGLVPSRKFQSYGGLHNFPRFLESWRQQNLFISGSFLSLKFSTQATSNFDKDAWEPRSQPTALEVLPFYSAPNRKWGYDVALQLARPGPVSSRLVNVGDARSEFYRELPAGDPYIANLRCATSGLSGGLIDPRAKANGDC